MQAGELVKSSQGKDSGDRLPALFIGHGSPMNGIEDNAFSAEWKRLGRELPKPKAILCVSAHWLTRGTEVTAMERPPTIHDFGGFPKELFAVQYPAPGSPELAGEVGAEAPETQIGMDKEWGLDHGAWTVIRHMYPEAKIPVLQLSIDYHKPPQYHYDLGRKLAGLRRKGFLVVGSGNMVHNLRMVAFDRMGERGFGFDWAHEMNAAFKQRIASGDHADLIDYDRLGKAARLAIPTPDHYYPLLYVLGMQAKGEAPAFFNDEATGGSLTMTSVRLG